MASLQLLLDLQVQSAIATVHDALGLADFLKVANRTVSVGSQWAPCNSVHKI